MVVTKKKKSKVVEKEVKKKVRAKVEEEPKKKVKKLPKPQAIEGRQEALCVKCKTTRRVRNAMLEYASNGRPMMKGECRTCGTKVSRFLSAEAAKEMVA